MLTKPFPITVINPDPPFEVFAEISPDSESILVINFKKTDGTALCSAVLLPAYTVLTTRYEPRTAVYPVFFPGGKVEVEYAHHYNAHELKTRPLVIITTRSSLGEIQTIIHGL